jgi:hypothetical protein
MYWKVDIFNWTYLSDCYVVTGICCANSPKLVNWCTTWCANLFCDPHETTKLIEISPSYINTLLDVILAEDCHWRLWSDWSAWSDWSEYYEYTANRTKLRVRDVASLEHNGGDVCKKSDSSDLYTEYKSNMTY